VFLQDASVHDDSESGLACRAGGFFVYDAFLKPDDAGSDANCRRYDPWDVFGAPKHVDDVDWQGDFVQRRPGSFPKDFSFVGVDRHDPITGRLHVLGNAEAGPPDPRR